MTGGDFTASNTSVGAIYRDLLEWGSTLPLWQQELLRRILRKDGLSEDEIDDLASAAVGELEQQATSFPPLSTSDLPSVAVLEDQRQLVAMRDLRSVNALRSDQTLSFGPQLTVVYGDNASGKSGYARVLKRVYRARVVEDILSDVRSDTPSIDPPRATFAVKTRNGAEELLNWEEGTSVSGLGRFAVLDSACSATYIKGGALAAGPAGIDVPRRFADALDQVKRRLGRRVALAAPDKRLLQRLENDTEVGRFVASLSSATSDAALRSNATWTEEDAAQLLQLEQSWADARSQTPSERRSQLRARLKAIESFGKRLSLWTTTVAQADNIRSATRTLAEANAALQAVQDLEGAIATGPAHTKAWIELLTAATQYVANVDSRTHVIRPMSIDGRCALCRQPLDETAQDQLSRFQEHLEGTAVKEQRQAARKVADLVRILQSIPDILSAEDEALLAADASLLDRVGALLSDLRERRDTILPHVEAGEVPPLIPAVDETPVESLRALYAKVQQQLGATPADDADGRAHIRSLEQALLELTTRRELASSLNQASEFVARTREHQRLKNAETAINTRAASTKAAALYAKHMTERYASLVDEELRDLRFRRRRPMLAQKTSKAKVEVTPLVSHDLKHIAPERVFSEGERTAIALACFLAELRLGDDSSGLIFDDPVSSLDHNVREHVARRLVTAAKTRQVIVFTHDLAFLADLREQAKKIQDVSCEYRTLTSTDYAAGFVDNEEPFGARSVKKRIGVLKQLLTAAERAAKNGELDALRSRAAEFYERLRSTWERFIEERLFATVVQRLERNVTPGALSKVAFSKELGEKVHEGWRRCSNSLEAHDHAPAAGGHTYSVEDMKADLAMLLDADALAPAI